MRRGEPGSILFSVEPQIQQTSHSWYDDRNFRIFTDPQQDRIPEIPQASLESPLRRDKGEERAIATRRIDVLLARARAEAMGRRGDLADRYVRIGLEIAQKYQSGLTPAQKAQVCRACGAFRVPGRTSRTRMSGGKVATTCLRCGDVSRRPLRRKVGAG